MRISVFKDANGQPIGEMNIVDSTTEGYNIGLVVFDEANDSWCIYEIPKRDLLTNEVIWSNVRYCNLGQEEFGKLLIIGDIFNRRDLLNGLTPQMIIEGKEL